MLLFTVAVTVPRVPPIRLWAIFHFLILIKSLYFKYLQAPQAPNSNIRTSMKTLANPLKTLEAIFRKTISQQKIVNPGNAFFAHLRNAIP
jgi:hypothetical protein